MFVYSLRTCGATSFMAKNKGVRIVVLLSAPNAGPFPLPKSDPPACLATTERNRRNTTERLALMKFCPQLNKMTLHKEIK